MSSLRFRINMLRKYKDLIDELVVRDIKLKYRRSILGYVWSVLNPLLVMIVLTVVFSSMFNKNIQNYPVYLLCGRMTYDFLQEGTNKAMRSVTGNAALMKKTYIPKYIFTVSKVTSCLVDYVFSLGALLIVMIVTRSPFYWTMLLLPVLFVQLYLFILGLGLLLATLHVFFRDVQYIHRALLVCWLYLTPIFYPIEQLPPTLGMLIKVFNPMYYYVAEMRDLVLHGTIPGPRIFWGAWIMAIVMMIVGIAVFQKHKDNFILYV